LQQSVVSHAAFLGTIASHVNRTHTTLFSEQAELFSGTMPKNRNPREQHPVVSVFYDILYGLSGFGLQIDS
jgi:hypothetical protein